MSLQNASCWCYLGGDWRGHILQLTNSSCCCTTNNWWTCQWMIHRGSCCNLRSLVSMVVRLWWWLADRDGTGLLLTGWRELWSMHVLPTFLVSPGRGCFVCNLLNVLRMEIKNSSKKNCLTLTHGPHEPTMLSRQTSHVVQQPHCTFCIHLK